MYDKQAWWVIEIGNRNRLYSITWFQVIVFVIVTAISRCNVIVIDYNVNVIITSDYFHDYTKIIYHFISCQRYGVVWKQKYDNITNLPIDVVISIHNDDLSVCWFREHERKMCWNTASDVADIISHINRHFRLTRVVFTWLSPS